MSFFPTTEHRASDGVKAFNMAIVGPPGSGKTTLACSAPDCLLLAAEAGYAYIDGPRVQPIHKWMGDGKDSTSFVDNVNLLVSGDHPFKWVVIDSMGALYNLAVAAVGTHYGFKHPMEGLQRCNLKSARPVDYGRAYSAVANPFKSEITKLFGRGFGVILISHDTERDISGKHVVDANIPKSAYTDISAAIDVSLYTYCKTEKNKPPRFIARTHGDENLACAKDRTGTLPPILDIPKYNGFQHILDTINSGLKE